MRQSFGEWYEKHGHLYLARNRVSESSSAKYGPGKDFALCVNQNLWHITMGVQMGLLFCVAICVRNSFLSGNFSYIIATQKKILPPCMFLHCLRHFWKITAERI